MKNNLLMPLAVMFLLSPVLLLAQRVLYSPFVGSPAATRFEVAGKAGDYYWVQKSRKSNSVRFPQPWINDRALSFEIYDTRMNRVNIVPYAISDTIVKEYLVAGNHSFDRLEFANSSNTTRALLNRYAPDGEIIKEKDTLACFPGNMKGNDFLLVRSQDNSKILLLGFEPVSGSAPRLHAMLYNQDWQPLYQTVYVNYNITQPIIQCDFINYPIENFDNNPVKLTNSGAWLMISPSRTSNNYLLFHFNGTDSSYAYSDIKLNQQARVQDLALSLDNDRKEAFAGILLNTRIASVKKARIAHYLLSQSRFDYDTAYLFNTSATDKIRDDNLFEQCFITVPGKGFMLLKEYGRPNPSPYVPEPGKADEEEDRMETGIASSIPAFINKNDYTRFGKLAGAKSTYDRGDLTLYYFPATTKDTCWSGIINKAQTNELNSSYLSYVFMPIEGRLVFLYNSLLNDSRYGSATILDQQGNSLNEGLIFWKANNTLNFQKARQISARELAIPYEKNMLNGFAIIRL